MSSNNPFHALSQLTEEKEIEPANTDQVGSEVTVTQANVVATEQSQPSKRLNKKARRALLSRNAEKTAETPVATTEGQVKQNENSESNKPSRPPIIGAAACQTGTAQTGPKKQEHDSYKNFSLPRFSPEQQTQLNKMLSEKYQEAEAEIHVAAFKNTPALWIQPGMVQKYETRMMKWYMTPSSIRAFKNVYPHIRLIPAPTQHQHFHPVLNFDREYTEEIAYNLVVRSMEKHGVKTDISSANPLMVVDIGGNASRHLAKHRVVHSCCPLLSPADHVREFNQPMSKLRCLHRVEECDCVRPIIYMAIQSLYYLPPTTIASLIDRTVLKALVATVHEFNDAFGVFANGEAQYVNISPDTVSMTVEGNGMSYTHNNLHWMKRMYYPLPDNRKLVWYKVGGSKVTGVYIFKITSASTGDDAPFTKHLEATMQSDDYYGGVDLRTSDVISDSINTVGGVISIPDVSVHSWGKWIFMYDTSKKVNMLCPKNMVSEIAAWAMGRDRTAANFQVCLTQFRYKLTKFNLPPSIAGQSLFACVALGFMQNVAFEAGVMHTLIKPDLPLLTVHGDALKFKFSTVWNRVSASIAIASAGLVAATVVGTVAHMAGPAAAIYTGAVAAAAAATTFLAGRSDQPGKAVSSKHSAPLDIFQNYLNDRSSTPNLTRVVPLPLGCSLPSTTPPATIEQMCDKTKMDSTASIDVARVDLSSNKDELTAALPLTATSIVSTASIPVVASRSVASEISAITSRVTKKGPADSGKLSARFLAQFEKWLFKPSTLTELGLDKNAFKVMSFDEWNSAYPEAIRLKHIKALAEYNSGNSKLSQQERRGLFVKIESLAKSTTSAMEKLNPRAIQSGSAEHNILTGPFFKSLSLYIKSKWSVNNDNGPMYTSGATAEQIGGVMHRMSQIKDLHAMEGDFARFDSTIHRQLLSIMAAVYARMGADRSTMNAIRAGIFTEGRTSSNIRYKVDGGRKSGDHDTSVGNTMLQCLAFMFIYCYHIDAKEQSIPESLHTQLKRDDPKALQELHDNVDITITSTIPLVKFYTTPNTLFYKYQWMMLALGDDNLTASTKELASVPVKQYLLLLGLELEPKYMDSSNFDTAASFCSAICLPAVDADGNTVHVLSTPIGRSYVKSGWNVDVVTSVPPDSYARSSYLCNEVSTNHIPFVRKYWQRVGDLTANVAGTKHFKREIHKATTIQKYYPCELTWSVVEQRYGLTREDEDEYETLLSGVVKLPSVVDFAKLTKAAVIDGVLESADMLDIAPIYSIEPSLDIVRGIDLLQGVCPQCLRPVTKSADTNMCSCGSSENVVRVQPQWFTIENEPASTYTSKSTSAQPAQVEKPCTSQIQLEYNDLEMAQLRPYLDFTDFGSLSLPLLQQ